jgi:single-strand DNA-binding protein
MSISYNKVILVGRLTRDPEIRTLPSGTNVANFGLAVDRNYNEEVDFINIVSFGKQSEFVGNYLSKGKLVLVEGSIRINKYTDRDGVNREKAEVAANKITFMETKKSQTQNSDYSNYNDMIKVEDSYENKSKGIKNIDDDMMSQDLPDFEDPFGDLDDDLNTDEKPI